MTHNANTIDIESFSELVARISGAGMMAKDSSGLDRPRADEVARLAYQFYDERGRKDGHDVQDWLLAEQILRHHYR